MNNEIRWAEISHGLWVAISQNHRFGTDAVLLTRFSGYHKKDLVVDLGTGCGIIPILMQEKDPPKKIYAVDIQPDAIEQLCLGLQKCTAVKSEIIPICADLRGKWEDAPLGRADLVVCNPPYKALQTGGESRIPAQKIARHEVLCTIWDVCAAAKRLLRFGGRLCVCNRPERLVDTIIAMRETDIEPKRLQFVGKPQRSPWLFLLEGRRGGGTFLRVLPRLTVPSGAGTRMQ